MDAKERAEKIGKRYDISGSDLLFIEFSIKEAEREAVLEAFDNKRKNEHKRCLEIEYAEGFNAAEIKHYCEIDVLRTKHLFELNEAKIISFVKGFSDAKEKAIQRAMNYFCPNQGKCGTYFAQSIEKMEPDEGKK